MAGLYTPPKLVDTPLPDLFTLIAQENPHRPFVQIIREHVGAPTDSIIFTWAEVIQHAQNAAADLSNRWNETNKNDNTHNEATLPRQSGSARMVVGLLANNGYELYYNVIACALNRWTVLLISPKNSPAAIEHLLRTSNSSLFLVEPANLILGHNMVQAIPGLKVQMLATFDPPATGPAPSPLTSLTPEELRREMELPAFYLHTSGSTGHPKIIPWSHEFVLSGARARRRDRDEFIGLPLYSVPPLIHAAGMIMYFMYAPAHGNLMTFVSSPIPKPPSANSLLVHLPFFKDGIMIVTPSILEDLCSLGPEPLKTVAEGTAQVSYTGAPLKPSIGDMLVDAGINLQARYGSTEVNCTSTHKFMKKPEDWQYISFREGYSWHFLPVDDHSNLRELIIGPGTDGCPAVINNTNPRGYATNDIWEPHPTVPNLWKHHSRKGDVTVLSNGEKSDNKQIQDLLLEDKRIRYVEVFGGGRPMNGVVIQPADLTVPTSAFLLQIQSTIEHANSIIPNHSRLVPELVIVATPDRPFATTDKGTVKRKETLEKFMQEIDAAYGTLDEGGVDGGEWSFEGDVGEKDDLKRFLRSAVKGILRKEVPDHEDLFAHGFDSLLSIRLRMAIVSVVKRTSTSSQPVPRNVVYTLPSINALTTYLLSRAVNSPADSKGTIEERVRRSISKYSADFIPHRARSTGRGVHGKVIALSGSTGSLGTSILALLLTRADVEKIYLLNRSGNESQQIRQAKGLEERGFDPTLLESKKGSIVYLDVEFSASDLGLADNAYEDLRDSVTHIIHAAWQLNFNFVLESYEGVHIAGVRHLINLALSSPHAQPPRLTFISSIGAAMMYRGPSQEVSMGDPAGQVLVPESPIDDPTMSLDQGYAHSKYVSERIIVKAVDAGLRATIVRVGQLCGTTTNGSWVMNEYIPIMLRSCITLGVAPHDLPALRWVPSDVAASALIKQAFNDSSQLQYFSIENPFPTPWKVITEALLAVSPKELRLIPLATWINDIRETNPDPKKVPATKLLDFYQSRFQGAPVTASLGWEKSVKLAPELGAGPITVELVKKYIIYQQHKAGKL